ncbi:Hypothetical protein NTJ_03497 [Nesidiocoris tenuis]|nr:Hypothetical protein NTJ_03497 [Nesidiocoris tenuis]
MKSCSPILQVALILSVSGLGWCTGPVYKTKVEVESSTETQAEEQTTQTVYGFLDFTTTIGNTVMVFSPQSQKVEIKPTPTAKIEATKPPAVEVKTEVQVKVSSKEEEHVKITPTKTKSDEHKAKKLFDQILPKDVKKKLPPSPSVNKIEGEGNEKEDDHQEILATAASSSPITSKHQQQQLQEPAIESIRDVSQEDNALEDLSKAPSNRISETFKVIGVDSTVKSRSEPTGLVTKLGGTIVKDGTTTVHETSVVGTYISGKYAQVLKSSSHVIPPKPIPTTIHKQAKSSKSPSASIEPTVLEDGLPLEALFTAPVGQNLVRHSRRPAVSPPFKNRLQRTKTSTPPPPPPTPTDPPQPTKRPASQRASFKLSHNRFTRSSSSSEIPTVSVYPESTRRYHRQRSATSTVSSNTIESGGRRFKPKPSPVQPEPSTSLYKFKLARPQGRWQYKTTPKPRVAIRRQDPDENSTGSSTPPLQEIEVSEEQAAENLEVSATPTPTLPIQTLKVEISTPANFSSVYYEIATIKSPYTFQVGTVKNTRYITLTTTLEKLLIDPSSYSSSNTEPLTENILTSTPVFDKEGPIVTLPVIALAAGETLPLETMTDTFSTSEVLLKTHLLPVVVDSNTTTITLVQTYEVTKVVSATKTLPPTELFQFIPSKTLNEFNTRLDEAGSELHLELEFGDNDNDEEQRSIAVLPDFPNATVEEVPSSTTPLPPTQEPLSPEKLQQLAFLRLLNPNQPPIVTTTPILTVQTQYETHVIPVFNGQNTIFSTISRPVKTYTSTQYQTSTIALPSLPLPFLPTPQLQPMITSSPVVTQTVVTATNSKVLKLTFGAKTAYTTLYSTTVVPTMLTTYVTTQFAVQPTAAFGAPSPFQAPFFPPFNPFNPYVG